MTKRGREIGRVLPPASPPAETEGPRLSDLYRDYAPFLGRLAARMGLDAADVEDAVHDIFIEIHQDLPTFRGRSSLKTWIYRVGVHHCLNRLRRRRRTALLPWTLLRGKSVAPVRREAAQGDVAALLEKLSPKLRAAVVLKDIEGLSYDEIAESLRIAPGTAMSRVARGREDLRRLFSGLREERG